MKKTLLTIIAIGMAASTASAVTLAHRYSFSGNLSDSAGGNTGVLQGGATVNATHLVLPGSGAGATANAMTFTNTVGIGANFAASGVTVETWYTDNNSGTWSKLFTFGTNAAGPEFAFTNVRANTGFAGLDRNGNTDLPFRPAIGVEHHLVIALAADGTVNLWLDGSSVLSGIATNAVSHIVSTQEAIGATAWGDPGHNGTVNEFRIWSGEFTQADVSASMALGPDVVVPEPASISLFGLCTLLLLRRRR